MGNDKQPPPPADPRPRPGDGGSHGQTNPWTPLKAELDWTASAALDRALGSATNAAEETTDAEAPASPRDADREEGVSTKTRVLLIGIKPEAVDFSDPDLPPGTTAEKIAGGIETTLADMRSRGWKAAFCSILTDDSAEPTIARLLAAGWDCVVVGGGIRIPSSNLRLFERVVNAVHRGAPGTPIAFNTSPNDSADAAARWIDRAR